MKRRPSESATTAADLLAILSLVSSRRGDASLARTRLAECLTSLLSESSTRTAAVAMDAAAELAVVLDQPVRAVEFYGARDRIARRAKVRETSEAAKSREVELLKLQRLLGASRFHAAWAASRATPYPVEFYVSQVLHWVEGLEWALSDRNAAEDASDSTTMGSTAHLLTRIRDGSVEARDQLTRRYLGPLKRFAHGRLPRRSRDLLDTDDLVQMTMIRGIEKAGSIRTAQRGGFFAYLRRILINQVRDEIRRHGRRPRIEPLDESVRSPAPTPLDAVLEAETFDAYRAALAKLPRRQRDALRLRVEYGLPYQEVSDELGLRSANAARMLVSRALGSVTKSMRRRV